MSYTLLSETKPVARKEYTCIWCGEKVLKQEKHTHLIGVFDGDFNDDRYHREEF